MSHGLTRFFLLAAILTAALTFLWKPLSSTLAAPSAAVAEQVLTWAFDGSWLYRSRTTNTGMLEMETRLRLSAVRGPDGRLYAVPPGRYAELTAEVNPARYGYGLAILWALFIASMSSGWWNRALLGSLVLVPFQALSTVALAVKEVVFSPGVIPQLGYAQWQLELIAFCYQFGVLVMPTIVPVLTWLCLDKDAQTWLSNLFVKLKKG